MANEIHCTTNWSSDVAVSVDPCRSTVLTVETYLKNDAASYVQAGPTVDRKSEKSERFLEKMDSGLEKFKREHE